jgi:hypothetical protein
MPTPRKGYGRQSKNGSIPHAAFFKKGAQTMLSPPKADSAGKAKMS